MNWTALIALKPPGQGKSRLAPMLDSLDRERLSLAMLDRLRVAIEGSGKIERIVVIARHAPDGWAHDWLPDAGRGFNGELDDAAAGCARPLLAIHADLPLVAAEDVAGLLAEAERCGMAIAPDRHGAGTNAIALADTRPFGFHFGPDSLAVHLAKGGSNCALVRCMGLALDCDTIEDLAIARDGGFTF